MTVLSIAPEQWHGELDSFSRQYAGWFVTVASRNPDGTASIEAEDVPLLGVSRASPYTNGIVVAVGTRHEHTSHEVENVAAISLEMTAERTTRALVLETADGATTTVTFRSPTRPEEVDGIAVDLH